MKTISKPRAAFADPSPDVAPPELAVMRRTAPIRRRQATRKPRMPRHRLRSLILFWLIVIAACLASCIAAQRCLAALFDDDLAAIFVTLTIAITVVGMAKPAFPGGRRR